MPLDSDFTILNDLLEGCQIIGFDWRYIFINDAAEQHNQRPKSELLGQRYMDMWPGISETHVFSVIKRCLEERVATQLENEFLFPDGKRGWFRLSIQPVPKGVFILSIDVTEHKLAAQSLLLSELKFSLVFEKAAFAAALSRYTDGVLVNVNEAFTAIFGYSKEEAIGKTTRELGINPDETGRIRILEELKSRGAIHNLELALRTRSGETRFFSISVDLIEIDTQKFLLSTTQDITDRRQAEMEIVRRLQNVQALQKIDQAIAGSLDLDLTLRVVLEQTKSELGVDAAAVLLFNPSSQMFEFKAGVGFRNKAIEKSRLRMGEGHAGRAALERKTIIVSDLVEHSELFLRAPLLAGEGFATYCGTPLIAKGTVNGILETFHRTQMTPDESWLDFFKVLAGQAAIAIDSASLFAELRRSNIQLFEAYDSTIEGWSHALDLRDKETEGHTLRVTELSLKLIRAAGASEEELIHVRRGALLHDIGKMGVPDHILLKPAALTDEEWVTMRKHPTFAFELLSPITYLRPALDIPYCHHEKWDGTGYPRGLKGDQIPLAARLFALVDVWDALCSDRPYRPGWPKDKILEHIRQLSGTHFDPKAVALFLKVMEDDDLGQE